MVSVVVHNPEWFLRTDIIFSAISIFVSLLVAVVSFRSWFVIKRLRYLAWSLAFLTLSGAFFTRMFANLVPSTDPFYSLTFYVGYGLHIVGTIFAFLTLFIVANKMENPRVMALFYLLIIPAIFLSASYFFSFYIITTIITAMLAATYLQHALKVKRFSSFCVFSAFLMLFLAHVQFLLSSLDKVFYFSASISQLLAFVLFLITIIKVLKS